MTSAFVNPDPYILSSIRLDEWCTAECCSHNVRSVEDAQIRSFRDAAGSFEKPALRPRPEVGPEVMARANAIVYTTVQMPHLVVITRHRLLYSGVGSDDKESPRHLRPSRLLYANLDEKPA